MAVATHPDVDVVLCASSGTAALEAVLAAIEVRQDHRARQQGSAGHGRRAGDGSGAPAAASAMLPVDSEHNAIHQCLHGRVAGGGPAPILTASGGPFRGRARESLADVTAADALKHPTWQMGQKITIDSATLMNKGLEVIEAHWLFGLPASQIDVVVHPQSVVHSMVELMDGSVLAQMGITDMRLPIQYAFSYPDRWDAPVPFLDLTRMGAAHVRGAGVGRLPLPRPCLSGARGRPQPPHRAQRRQRGGGGVVSRGDAEVYGHSGADRPDHGRAPCRTGGDTGGGATDRRLGQGARGGWRQGVTID